MPSLADHESNQFVKLLLLGDSKTGKTGSLASLVGAGYKLRILDFDNLLHFFKSRVKARYPDQINNVEYFTCRDNLQASSLGMAVKGSPKAWITGIKMLDHWKYGNVDFGVPATWGPDTILVIDSLSRLADAAYMHHERITPTGKSGDKDGRAVYYNTQKDLEKVLAMLTGDSFRCNVIVICHGMYQEMEDSRIKIWPQSIGKALGPIIPEYFPNYVRYVLANDKRTMQLDSNNMISLANGNPDILKGTFDVEIGLAKFFSALLESPKAKVTSLRMKAI